MDASNPLIPASYDIVWSVIAAAAIALIVAAFISLARTAKEMSGVQTLVWVLVVLLIPILGAAAWLFIGRRAQRTTGQPRG